MNLRIRQSIQFFLIFSSLLSSGCNVKVSDTNSQSFSYSLNENGCPTGSKSFRSREEMCDSLKSDSANNYCAQTLRYQKFQQDCSDRSWF
jgi:hypothetical protein